MTNGTAGQRSPRAAASDVLRLLIDRRHWTRAELAHATSLSRATIVSRLDALREVGLVRDVGRLSPEGGRPTTKIALNDRVCTVAGIELGHSSCQITIADLGIHLIDQATIPVAYTDDYETILESIVSTLRALLAGTEKEHGPLASVTLGLPMSANLNAVGLLRTKGVNGWMGFPAREWLETELGVSVHLENDVNLMALGERATYYPDVDDILLVHIADGIGTAAIAGGQLVRGATGLAGEIAHVPTPRPHTELCLCGNSGCLGAIATLPAVLRTLQSEGIEASSLDDLMTLVAHGDATAARALREAGRHVGDVLVYSISSTNPQVLILSGSLAFAGDYLVAGIRETLYRASSTALTEGLRVLRSTNPLESGTLGALKLSAEHVLTGGDLFALLDEPSRKDGT